MDAVGDRLGIEASTSNTSKGKESRRIPKFVSASIGRTRWVMISPLGECSFKKWGGGDFDY